MRGRIVQALVAAAAAGGALLTVGLGGTMAAAGTHAAGSPVIQTSSQAGYHS